MRACRLYKLHYAVYGFYAADCEMLQYGRHKLALSSSVCALYHGRRSWVVLEVEQAQRDMRPDKFGLSPVLLFSGSH